jgi:hypothetical protein
MPRQRSVRAAPPLQETAPATPLASNDPVYRALLAAESTAYSAWLSYGTTQYGEAKEELSALRRTYEQKRAERRANRPPDQAELSPRPRALPWL